MARLRYNGLTTTLGAPLSSGDTTVTFAAALTHAGGAVPTISGGDIIALSLLDASGAIVEIVSLTAYTSGATTGTITRAQESTTAAAHASGANVVHGPTAADFAASGGGVPLTKAARSTGDINLSATSRTAVVSDGSLDLTIAAVAGDELEIVLAAILEGSGGASVNCNFSAYTRAAGADVNNIATPAANVVAWFSRDMSASSLRGTHFYTVQAEDLSGGTVTLRLYYTKDSGANRTLYANASNPINFAVKNLG